MPVWTLNELKICNDLPDETLKVVGALLEDRFWMFGRIPRCAYSRDNQLADDLTTDIAPYDALKAIEYATSNSSVDANDFSYKLLLMVPNNTETYDGGSMLSFLSGHIWELLVARISEESQNKLTELTISNMNYESGNTASLVGRIFGVFCHMWFTSKPEIRLNSRNLVDGATEKLRWKRQVRLVMFDNLNEIYFIPTIGRGRKLSVHVVQLSWMG